MTTWEKIARPRGVGWLSYYEFKQKFWLSYEEMAVLLQLGLLRTDKTVERVLFDPSGSFVRISPSKRKEFLLWDAMRRLKT